jgi:hypothetical protein
MNTGRQSRKHTECDKARAGSEGLKPRPVAFYIPDFSAHPELLNIENWDKDMFLRTGYSKQEAVDLIKLMLREFPSLKTH